MTKNAPLKRFNHVLLFIVLLFGILHVAETFLIPIAISGLMAMLLVPPSRWLERHRVPRGLAAGVCVLVTLLLILGVMYVLVNQVINLGKDMSSIGTRFELMMNNGHDFFYEHFQIPIDEQKAFLQSKVAGLSDTAGRTISNLLRSLAGFAANLLIITTYTVLFIIYRRRLKNFVLKIVTSYGGRESLPGVRSVVEQITGVAGSYLAGVFSVVLILTVLYTIGLMIIGLENALFFALLVALINIIPYIGSFAGSAIVIAYALITRDTLTMPIVLFIFFTALQQVDSYFLTPRITGSRVALSPLFTIMAMLLGSLIWGVAGMILFIPLIGVAKVIFDHVDALKPYGYLIGARSKRPLKQGLGGGFSTPESDI